MYKYITENNLENKQNYMYSEYGGAEFLVSYLESRYIEGIDTDNTDHISALELSDVMNTLSKEHMFVGGGKTGIR